MSLFPILLLLVILVETSMQGDVQYHSSQVLRGRKYYVSKKHEPFNLAKMNDRCKKLGGYLVQIDNKQEHCDVIFTAYDARGIGPFFTGITDEGSEGRYYYYNDKKPAKYFKWRWFQPDNWKGREHCVTFWRYRMNDLSCAKRGRYVCEVPV